MTGSGVRITEQATLPGNLNAVTLPSAIHIDSGGRVELSDLYLQRRKGFGILARGHVRLSSVSIREMQSISVENFDESGVTTSKSGNPIQVLAGADVEIDGFVFDSPDNFAAASLGGRLVLRDGLILGPRATPYIVPSACAGGDCSTQYHQNGWALLHRDSDVTLERVRITGASEFAIHSQSLRQGIDTNLTLRDVTIEDTTHRDSMRVDLRDWGRAIELSNGVNLEGHRIHLAHAQDIGLLVGEGSTATVVDLSITDVEPPGCCADNSTAAVAVLAGGEVTLSDFELASSALAGLFVDDGGDFSLENGLIRDNAIGVSLQQEGTNLSLLDDVTFTDNQLNVDSATLPPPRVFRELFCSDGIDNDNDDRVDCADLDCAEVCGS